MGCMEPHSDCPVQRLSQPPFAHQHGGCTQDIYQSHSLGNISKWFQKFLGTFARLFAARCIRVRRSTWPMHHWRCDRSVQQGIYCPVQNFSANDSVYICCRARYNISLYPHKNMDMWESPFLELNSVHMRNARTKDSNIKKVTLQFGKSKVEGAHNEIRPVMSLLS